MPRQLSGGQAQRVALARALAADPDVLLLDEPLAGLDVAAATAMRKVLRNTLARDGRSAVLITHDLLDVLTLADRVLVLESGRVAETGSVGSGIGRAAQPFRRAVRRSEPRQRHRGSRRRAHHRVGRPHGTAPRRRTSSSGSLPSRCSRRRGRGLPRQAARQPAQHRRGDGGRAGQSGPAVRVRADEQPDGAPGLAADITAESAAELRLAPGERVYFSVKAQEVAVHPAA